MKKPNEVLAVVIARSFPAFSIWASDLMAAYEGAKGRATTAGFSFTAPDGREVRVSLLRNLYNLRGTEPDYLVCLHGERWPEAEDYVRVRGGTVVSGEDFAKQVFATAAPAVSS